jgi:hypothetical protein
MRFNRAGIHISTALLLWAALVLAGLFWFRDRSSDGASLVVQKEYHSLISADPDDPLRSVKLLAAATRGLFP